MKKYYFVKYHTRFFYSNSGDENITTNRTYIVEVRTPKKIMEVLQKELPNAIIIDDIVKL